MAGGYRTKQFACMMVVALMIALSVYHFSSGSSTSAVNVGAIGAAAHNAEVDTLRAKITALTQALGVARDIGAAAAGYADSVAQTPKVTGPNTNITSQPG